MSSSPASPTWQALVFLAAGLFLLWELWAGWRRGIIRAGLHFVAFVLSGFIGIIAGKSAAALMGWISPGSAALVGLVVGAVVMLLVLGLALLLSAILFKRTAQQPPGPMRLLFGGGGAFFGLLTGVFILWSAISLIRFVGTISETAIARTPAEQVPVITRIFATLKESLELGPVGETVKSIDPVSPQTYLVISRVSELAKNEDAMRRFLDYPGIQEVLQNPLITPLLNDPQMAQAASDGNYLAIMQNPALLRAAQDPDFQKQLASIDLAGALEYALPTPSPTPKP